MRTIALEEHFASPGFLDGPGHELNAQALKFGAAAAKLFEKLCDVGEKRIAEMDAARDRCTGAFAHFSRHRTARGGRCDGAYPRVKWFTVAEWFSRLGRIPTAGARSTWHTITKVFS
jgi:hypothetical protein